MAVSSEIIATAWQQLFTWLPTLPVSKSDFIVFVNSVIADISSYERTSQTAITFDYGLNANDVVRILVPSTPTQTSGNVTFPDSPTLWDLISKVRSEMKLDRTWRIWGDADVIDAINSAILEVQKKTFFGWQYNDTSATILTTADQYIYDLPLNIQGATVITLNGSPMRSTQKEFVVENEGYTGTPTYYAIWNGKLQVFPTPTVSNQVIELYFQKILTPLVDTTDLLPFPYNFTRAVVLFASYDLFSQTSDSQNYQRGQIKKQRYTEEINKLVLAYLLPDRWQLNEENIQRRYTPRVNRYLNKR